MFRPAITISESRRCSKLLPISLAGSIGWSQLESGSEPRKESLTTFSPSDDRLNISYFLIRFTLETAVAVISRGGETDEVDDGGMF